jgi:hypothetical protein
MILERQGIATGENRKPGMGKKQVRDRDSRPRYSPNEEHESGANFATKTNIVRVFFRDSRQRSLEDSQFRPLGIGLQRREPGQFVLSMAFPFEYSAESAESAGRGRQ